VVISAFLSGPGLSPSVNTVATLTVAVVGIGVLLASLWLARSERRRAQEMVGAYRAAGN